MPWQWPRWEHLSKMKIFWKHSAIFLSHTFATKFIMNSDEIPSPAFHTKGQLHVHFLRISCRDYHGAEGCAKKRDLFRCFELIKLSSITETLVIDTCSRNKMLWGICFPGDWCAGGKALERGFRASTTSIFAPHVPGLRTRPLPKMQGLRSSWNVRVINSSNSLSAFLFSTLTFGVLNRN